MRIPTHTYVVVGLGLFLTGRTFSAASSRTSRPKHIVITHKAQSGIRKIWRIPRKSKEPITKKRYGTLLEEATKQGSPLFLCIIHSSNNIDDRIIDLCALLRSRPTQYNQEDFYDDHATGQTIAAHLAPLSEVNFIRALTWIKSNGKAMKHISYILDGKTICDTTLFLRFSLAHDLEALKALALVNSLTACAHKTRIPDAQVWLSLCAKEMPDDPDIPSVLDIITSDMDFVFKTAKIAAKIPESLVPDGFKTSAAIEQILERITKQQH